ncbi:MAG TPA: hypothetical protein VHC95_06935 [Opitutales bacterium]|nr:hypothetical protein [Opitutales bacterium]
MNTPNDISEKDLAALLGMPRKKLAEARTKLTSITHYRQQGRLIIYTPEGQAAVQAALVKPSENNTPAAPADPAQATPRAEATAPPRLLVKPTAGPRRAQLTCLRTFTTNERILEATEAGSATVLRVRVRSNKQFRPGMQFRAVHLDGTLWALDQDLPRSPRDNRFWPKKTTPTTSP